MSEMQLQFVGTQMDIVEHIILLLTPPLHHGQLFKLLEKHHTHLAVQLTINLVVIMIVPLINVTLLVVLDQAWAAGLIYNDGAETMMELWDVRPWRVNTIDFYILKAHELM